MASKDEIMGLLAGESGPTSRTALAKKLNLPLKNFQSQLDRMEKQGLAVKNEQKEYTLTDEGRACLLAEEQPDPAAGTTGFNGGDETPPTEESLKTTEYQQFIEMGRVTGVVPMPLINQTASHIWRGGDFQDLSWVWKGLTEMGIRPDLARRWFHSWRSFLNQAVPANLASQVSTLQPAAEKAAADKGEADGKGKRAYIIDGRDLPVFVGEGLGDLDYQDALDLAKARAIALARGGVAADHQGQPQTPGSMADEVVKIFNAFQQTAGPQTAGKSYIVKPEEGGGYAVEEIEEGRPMLLPMGQGNHSPSPSFLVDSAGEVQEIPPGQPVVIKPPPADSQKGTQWLVDKASGEVKEVTPGQPVVIIRESAPAAQGPPIQVTDKDGNPVILDLGTFIKLEDHKARLRQEGERHDALMGLTRTVRENIGDGIAALKAAAEEAKGSQPASGGQESNPPQSQQYECPDCHTRFALPRQDFEGVACPSCHREWTREGILGA